MILYPEIETLSQLEIKEKQLHQINKILLYIENTPYYKGKLPEQIQSLEGIIQCPLLSKNDLRKAFPYGLLSCPMERVIRFNASSGTTEIPTLSYCSQKDLRVLAQNEALHFSHAGLS